MMMMTMTVWGPASWARLVARGVRCARNLGVAIGLGVATIGMASESVASAITITAPVDVTAAAGRTFRFGVVAQGAGTLRYQWQWNGADIRGATKAAYQATATAQREGSYRVRVTDAVGAAVSVEARLTVLSKPVLATQSPARVNVAVGTGWELAVEALGTAPFTYQWRKKAGSRWVDLAGETAPQLTRVTATAADAGVYGVVVRNTLGQVISRSMTVAVLMPPGLTADLPPSAKVALGRRVTLQVAAVGSAPLTYEWSKDGVRLAGNKAAYAVTAKATSAGVYRVVVRNAVGVVASAECVVEVRRAPAISRQPRGGTLWAGAGLDLSVEATGDGPLTYAWSRQVGRAYVPIDGENEASLRREAAVMADAGVYRLSVTNDVGEAVSRAVSVVVRQAPVIRVQPVAELGAGVGQNVTMAVVADGSGSLSYQWYRNGVALSGARQASLSFAMSAGRAGTYRVLVKNSLGRVESTACELRLANVPQVGGVATVSDFFEDGLVLVTKGNGFSLEVEVQAEAGLFYQWLRDGVEVPGATVARYEVAAAVEGQSGRYRCRVSNAEGAAFSREVQVLVGVPPQIVTNLPAGGVAVEAGRPWNLAVTAAGTGPLDYVWERDGVVLATTAAQVGEAVATDADAGNYRVTVANYFGEAFSRDVRLTVTPPPGAMAPRLVLVPVRQAVLEPFQSLELSVRAYGSPALSYAWFKDGEETFVDTPVYPIIAATEEDAGVYRARFSNALGTSNTINIQVAVRRAPVALAEGRVVYFQGEVRDSRDGSYDGSSSLRVGPAGAFTREEFGSLRPGGTTGKLTYVRTSNHAATLEYEARSEELGSREVERGVIKLTFTSVYGGTYATSGSYSGYDNAARRSYSGTFTDSGDFQLTAPGEGGEGF